MPTKKTTRSSAGKSTTRATTKKRAPRKRAAKAAPEPTQAAQAVDDRLTEVAKTIGSTVGEIVAKTKHALQRKP